MGRLYLSGNYNGVMSSYQMPENSKADVRKAGEAIANGKSTPDHEIIAQNWRDSHAYILNTFQANLRRWIKDRNIIFVQRLKKLNTIKDKLSTKRAGDLSKFNDLAGCRLIFESVDDLYDFRNYYQKGTSAKHKRINGDRYNYIENPKDTGYRQP